MDTEQANCLTLTKTKKRYSYTGREQATASENLIKLDIEKPNKT
ncbi:hypothetical protein Hs20B_18390 [Lactococcus insecticola]|uniref:Uncharacterized protein n=1 Tax=Pseudolactococcus insecticola TaxID=2709158 RepID=A0A6A0BAF9_9LACT|nr:hypothetical protein Hs20B_18390 [Lactococcus insecticola]